VSADLLLFGKDGRGPDEELRLQFEAVSKFDPEEKKVIRSLLDGMIFKHRRWPGNEGGPKVDRASQLWLAGGEKPKQVSFLSYFGRNLNTACFVNLTSLSHVNGYEALSGNRFPRVQQKQLSHTQDLRWN
jgi:hypothetical protein